MSAVEPFAHEVSESIRTYAMTFPESSEGSSCVNRAFKTAGKNFVFLGEQEALCTLRLKLAAGWTKVEFDPDDPPSAGELEAWIAESFELLAPKRVLSAYRNG